MEFNILLDYKVNSCLQIKLSFQTTVIQMLDSTLKVSYKHLIKFLFLYT